MGNAKVVIPTPKKRFFYDNDGKPDHAYLWYVEYTTNIDTDEVSQQESVDYIKKILDNEIRMLGDSRKVCIAGFSQGGVMALRVGLEYD